MRLYDLDAGLTWWRAWPARDIIMLVLKIKIYPGIEGSDQIRLTMSSTYTLLL